MATAWPLLSLLPLPRGDRAAFLCHLLSTHCCMSPVCQPIPGSGTNTSSQRRRIIPRGEGARLPSCPSSPGIEYPCPLTTLSSEGHAGWGLILVLSPESREDGMFHGRRLSHAAIVKMPIKRVSSALCFSLSLFTNYFPQEVWRGFSTPLPWLMVSSGQAFTMAANDSS